MATTTTLESEFLKRNTDCVYFLASPLTCKKGSECEYRHSDIARLNPRDCWYWLSGNCLNPTCAFRHPPLEGLTDASSNSVHVAHHSVVTTSRTNVPCYFFFNTYCMKGDQCPFSHAMDDISNAQKLPKAAALEAVPSHLLGNKASVGSDTGPAAVEVPENPTEGTSKGLVTETRAKDVIDDKAPNYISEEASPSRESPRSSNPDYEENIAKSPDNPSPEVKYVNGRDDSFTDCSPVELVKDHTEADEWWESSPGFDVLVDDGSEQLAYEDDSDYLQVQERESGRLHNDLMHYDYEDSAAYDPMDYPDAEFVYGQGLYDAYEHFNDVCAPDYLLRSPEPSGERMLEQMLHRKRRSSHRAWDVQQHEVDLRDHLRKRRRVDAGLVSRDSRKHRPSHTKSAGQEHSVRHSMRLPCLDRLSLELGREPRRNKVRSSHSESKSALDESHRRGGRLVYPRFCRPVVHSRNSEMQPAFDENHRRLACRYFGRPIIHSRRRENRGGRGRWERHPSLAKVLAIKETRPTQVSVSSFNVPKIQSQLREEKRNVIAGRQRSENYLPRQQRRALSTDFEGPKSLSELLKDKKKFTSVGDSRNDSTTDYEQADRNATNGYLDEETSIHHHITDRLDASYKSEFWNDAEDDADEDDLATKVAGILA